MRDKILPFEAISVLYFLNKGKMAFYFLYKRFLSFYFHFEVILSPYEAEVAGSNPA